MPQLSQLALVYQSQWFWLLIALGVIYFFVGRGILPKVETTVDKRDDQIAVDLAEAERLRAEADASEEAWRTKLNDGQAQGQALIAEAKAKASADAAKRVAATDKRLDKKIAKAAAELEEAREAALDEIEGVAADAAKSITAKLAGVKISDAAARKALAGVMKNA